MAFWTYMLRCSDSRYYTGHTNDLEHRMGQHQCGRGGEFARHRLPVKPVWSKNFGSRIEMLETERSIGGQDCAGRFSAWLEANTDREAEIDGHGDMPFPDRSHKHEGGL